MKGKRRQVTRLPLTHALAWIVGSTLLISGSAHLCLKYYFQHQWRLARDPRHTLRTIVQTGPQKEALKTEYLAEILKISSDRPPSTVCFDLKAAEHRLLRSPLISRAQVKLIQPDTLYVDYTVRQPIAWLYDYENVVIDKEGYPFPFRPFFSPKNLPEIYLGMAPFGLPAEDPERPIAEWGEPLRGKYIQLALTLLTLLSDPQVRDLFQVRRIDVSHAFAESYGTREIVLVLEDSLIQSSDDHEVTIIFPKILRLSTKGFAQELGNYLKLRKQLVEDEQKGIQKNLGTTAIVRQKEKVIDFRIANLAFVDEP